MLGCRGVLPFYLDNRTIYIPFKMRRPLAPGDHCYGYVRQDQAADIVIKQSAPFIRISNGSSFELACTLSGARQNLEAGRRLAALLAPKADEEELVIEAIRRILAWLRK